MAQLNTSQLKGYHSLYCRKTGCERVRSFGSPLAKTRKNEQALLTIGTCKACKVVLIALLRLALVKAERKKVPPNRLNLFGCSIRMCYVRWK